MRQQLTELPNLEISGSDYDTTLSEIKKIIENNPSYKDVWKIWQEGTAGNLLTSISAYILDNLNTKQDLLFNEMFISTASKDESKRRLLKLIGYVPNFASAAKAAIQIELDNYADSNIIVVPNKKQEVELRLAEIPRFEANNVDGESTTWEILKITDGKPDYLESIFLNAGNTEYKLDKNDNQLYALEGKTVYEEFITETSNGPFFNLQEKDIAADSIQIYIKKDLKKLLQVNSFVSTEALDKTLPIPYILEMEDDGTKRIRFANSTILAKERLLPAGSTISVFYRTCTGSKGNVYPGTISTQIQLKDEYDKTVKATVVNILNGDGGTDAESLDVASLNGPLSLRTMDRAVTPDDYEIILNKNPLIFKSATYTSTNQPDSFKDYYGRFINPQESFTFVLLNKNYSQVPASKYNDFPWINLIKEPRLNERYVFDNAEYDGSVSISPTYYNFSIIEGDTGIVSFKNATVLKLSEQFSNGLFDTNGQENPILKLKLTTQQSDASFFGDIPFSLFYNENTPEAKLTQITMQNSVISTYDNARYITPVSFKKDTPIDVSKSRYINFSIDGKSNVEIDLWVQRKSFINASAEEKFDKVLDSEGYLTSAYYLLWDNNGSSTALADFGDDSTMEYANRRDGIVQIINKSIVNLTLDSTNNQVATYEPGVSWQYFNLNITNYAAPLDFINLSSPINLAFSVNDTKFIFTLNPNLYAEVLSVLHPSATSDTLGYNRGSLAYLVDWLNYVFKYGNGSIGLKKVDTNGNKITPTDDDYNLLNGLEATFVQVIDSNGESASGVYNSYDLVIRNTSQDALTTITITDGLGINHSISNVINFGDFFISASEGMGFVHYVKKATTSLSYRTYIPYPTQAVDTYEEAARTLQDPNDEESVFFAIYSPTIGTGSSIIFSKTQYGTDFAKNNLSISYDKNGYSNKVFGEKKLYLVKSNALGCYVNASGIESNISQSVNTGDLIFENSCLFNTYDFTTLYASFKVDQNDKLLLGSVYENFYYSGDENVDLVLKQDISGISGQSMDYEVLSNGVKKWFINENKTKFDIRFTKKPVETNSIYPIESDLNAVCCEKVKIQTADIKETFQGSLCFNIDETGDIVIDCYMVNSAKKLQDKILFALKNLDGTSILNKNRNSIISKSYQSINQLEFKNVSSENGSIVFKSCQEDKNAEKQVYRNLFGTNKTNENLYSLYPTDMFASVNVVNIDDEEYYYCPTVEFPLTFTYRKLMENQEGELESRAPDYYISTDCYTIDNQNKYTYYLNRTDNSRFPDSYFYVHLINDKTWDYDVNGKLKECDETILQDYMKKYMISGTDIIFLKPYFRTYDFVATVYYNSNFSRAEVVQEVSKAVQELTNIEKADINGSMSKAQIIKAILSCNGVDDCRSQYFGYNYSEKDKYPSTEILNADFYEILVAHEFTETRGIILNFEVSN